jgi:ubiquinone/menaquinone biosynthesis C-methylase UbiE
VGLDVLPGPAVDVVVASNEHWPLPDEKFDVILSSQVLEHVEHLDITLDEMRRVLKRGGVAILTFPFLYNEHGAPWDYRRFTGHQAEKLFPDCEVCISRERAVLGAP